MRPDMPLHRKLGYDYMLEITKIRAELCEKNPNISGIALHFDSIREYENRHAGDPNFKERQQAWLHAATTKIDPHYALLDALMAIADGHNDPRKLAHDTLVLVGLK